MTHTQNQGFTDDFTPIFDEVHRDFWTTQTVEDAHDELGLEETGSDVGHISRAATIAYWTAFSLSALVLIVCAALWIAHPDWRA